MLKGQQNSNTVFHSVKVMASSREDYPEATNEIYDTDKIIQRVVDTFYSLKHGCDVCADAEDPSMFVIPGHPVTKGFLDMKKRGIRLRFITEITTENTINTHTMSILISRSWSI
jgi:hypothetical protein